MKVTEYGYREKDVAGFYADKEVLMLCFDAITRKLNGHVMMNVNTNREYVVQAAEALSTLAKLIKKLEETEKDDSAEKDNEENT